MNVPDRLTSAAEAGVAIADYLTFAASDPLAVALGMPYVPKHYERLARAEHRVNQLLDQLAAEPGPGPGVEAHVPGDVPRFIGRQTAGRTSIRITEPRGSDYGLQGVTDPLPELAELLANIRCVRLLAIRAGTCAAADRVRPGRTRQAERLEAEAEALINYASDLERHVEPLGAYFLGDWRAELAARPAEKPAKARHPLARAVELRKNP